MPITIVDTSAAKESMVNAAQNIISNLSGNAAESQVSASDASELRSRIEKGEAQMDNLNATVKSAVATATQAAADAANAEKDVGALSASTARAAGLAQEALSQANRIEAGQESTARQLGSQGIQMLLSKTISNPQMRQALVNALSDNYLSQAEVGQTVLALARWVSDLSDNFGSDLARLKSQAAVFEGYGRVAKAALSIGLFAKASTTDLEARAINHGAVPPKDGGRLAAGWLPIGDTSISIRRVREQILWMLGTTVTARPIKNPGSKADKPTLASVLQDLVTPDAPADVMLAPTYMDHTQFGEDHLDGAIASLEFIVWPSGQKFVVPVPNKDMLTNGAFTAGLAAQVRQLSGPAAASDIDNGTLVVYRFARLGLRPDFQTIADYALQSVIDQKVPGIWKNLADLARGFASQYIRSARDSRG